MASTTRITGMYSGMDTEKLVEEMLAANKTPLNNYQREKTEVEWQRETLIGLNSQLLELQNMSTDMKKESNFKIFTTETTDSRIATATATTEALEGTYRITTHQLATSTTYTSEPVSKNSNMTSIRTKKMYYGEKSFENTSFNITLNGVTKTISFGSGEGLASASPSDMANLFQKKIDDAFGANQIKVNVDPKADHYRLQFECGSNALQVPISVTSGGDADAGIGDALEVMGIESGKSNIFDTTQTIADFCETLESQITFTVNGHTETISTQTTIADFFKKINTAGIDISMKYDSLSDAVIMKRTSSGAGREIEVEDNVGLFNALGFNIDASYKSGQNALVTITDPEGRVIGERTAQADGTVTGGLELTSNSFTYEGVNFNLLKASPNEEVSITVAKDVDKIFDNVVKFVDKYNEVLGKLNELYNEKPNRDYDPLLDEERDELSDSQQEKWDKLAREGLLYRDSTLQTAITSMRDSVTSLLATSDDINSLFQIGITTTQYSSVGNNNGKLVVDEQKLKEAISNNMDEVASLFTSEPEYITGTVIDVENTTISQGSSFKITVNGKQETITFDKDYNLSDEEQRATMLSDINTMISSKFGAKNIVVALSSNRLVVNSQKGSSITLNSGDGTDALAALGLEDGATYDAKALGFAGKIFNIMEMTQDSISDKAGSSSTSEDESVLGEKMSQLNKYISKQKEKLETLEDRYYSQFAAMENALAQLDSQSSYLNSMLSGSGMM